MSQKPAALNRKTEILSRGFPPVFQCVRRGEMVEAVVNFYGIEVALIILKHL
jgi:hypothetical protein